MNEASSKFVDKLAIEKLIREKLAVVSHSPNQSFFAHEDKLFDGLEKCYINTSKVKVVTKGKDISSFEIPSFQNSFHYIENNTVHIYYHPAENPVCNILLMHGLFDDNMFNYAFLIKLLNELKLNVFFMILPYHLDRKPAESVFSGEFFLSADIYRTQKAFRQAVCDVHAALQFIESYNSLPQMVAGFSMGGCIAFRHYLLKKCRIATFIINPVTDLTGLIWDNPLLKSIGQDLKKSKFDMNEYDGLFVELDPCRNLDSGFNTEKIGMVYSIYDQIILGEKNDAFIKRTGMKNVSAYHSGHLNILRVPKLSKDIFDFFQKTIC